MRGIPVHASAGSPEPQNPHVARVGPWAAPWVVDGVVQAVAECCVCNGLIVNI